MGPEVGDQQLTALLLRETATLRLHQDQEIQKEVTQIYGQDTYIVMRLGLVALAFMVVDIHHDPTVLDVDTI